MQGRYQITQELVYTINRTWDRGPAGDALDDLIHFQVKLSRLFDTSMPSIWLGFARAKAMILCCSCLIRSLLAATLSKIDCAPLSNRDSSLTALLGTFLVPRKL